MALAATPCFAQYGLGGPSTSPAQVPVPRAEPAEPGTRPRWFEPYIGLDETLTTNANFDRGRENKEWDAVTVFTPGVRINAVGAHSSLVGTVEVPTLIYARTGDENNRVIPLVQLNGQVDAFERLLSIEAGASVTRQFLTPFGQTPVSIVNNTANEYIASVYHVTPSLHGATAGNLRYEIHDANIWTHGNQAPSAINDSYTNDLLVSLSRDPVPFGGGFTYGRTAVLFPNQQSLTTEITRLRGEYAPDPAVRVFGSVGYETNDYRVVRYDDTIYGIGVRWRPTERTTADASWEHRFFGSAYHVSAEHRTPRTVWSVLFSRDITSYPQQLASLSSGTNVSALLNNLFLSRFPDPVQRQQIVNQVIQQYGLPTNLNGPVNLYTQQITLVTDFRATAGFLGVRNNVYVNAFRTRNQAIGPSEASLEIAPIVDVTQIGTNVVWSSKLTPSLTLTGILDYLHTKGGFTILSSGTSNSSAATVTLSTPLSAQTDFHVGTRYQVSRSDVHFDTDEAAVFVGIVHRFH